MSEANESYDELQNAVRRLEREKRELQDEVERLKSALRQWHEYQNCPDATWEDCENCQAMLGGGRESGDKLLPDEKAGHDGSGSVRDAAANPAARKEAP